MTERPCIHACNPELGTSMPPESSILPSSPCMYAWSSPRKSHRCIVSLPRRAMPGPMPGAPRRRARPRSSSVGPLGRCALAAVADHTGAHQNIEDKTRRRCVRVAVACVGHDTQWPKKRRAAGSTPPGGYGPGRAGAPAARRARCTARHAPARRRHAHMDRRSQRDQQRLCWRSTRRLRGEDRSRPRPVRRRSLIKFTSPKSQNRPTINRSHAVCARLAGV